MSSYNSNITRDCYWVGAVQICLHSGATYHICCMVAETISVKCTEHSYQHSAADLALILCTGLSTRWVGLLQEVIVAPPVILHLVR